MPHILIADDHDLVRDTIASYLETVADFTVSTAADVDAALKVLSGIDPVDLVLLDYNMPGMRGLEGLDRIKRRNPSLKVALLSGVASREVATDAMARGADGFVPKSMSAPSMVNAIRFVLSGERYLPVELDNPSAEAEAAFPDLSPRERQTLQQLGRGLSNKEIARVLGVQEATVKLHVRNLMAKLGVTNRTQAALVARDRQLF